MTEKDKKDLSKAINAYYDMGKLLLGHHFARLMGGDSRLERIKIELANEDSDMWTNSLSSVFNVSFEGKRNKVIKIDPLLREEITQALSVFADNNFFVFFNGSDIIIERNGSVSVLE